MQKPPEQTTEHTVQVAMYWPGEGYGIPADVATMEEAEAKAKSWADQKYHAGRAEIHIIETVRRVRVYGR